MGRGRVKAKQTRVDTGVPDLLGLTTLEARRVGLRAGLCVVGPDGDSRSLSQLHGPVIRQHPEAGTIFDLRAEVTVWTSDPGGDAGVREPRRPIPPTRGIRAISP